MSSHPKKSSPRIAESGVPAAQDTLLPVRLSVDLPVTNPYDAPGVFQFLAARSIDGVETADLKDSGNLRYARTLQLPGGPAAVEVLATGMPQGGWRLRANLELFSSADVAPVTARLRRMFDLDAEPMAIDSALAGDGTLAERVEQTPGIRVPGAADAHELVVRAIVGQQISVSAARTHLGRLASRVGEPYLSSFTGLDRLFPQAAQIAAAVPEPAPGDELDPDRPLRLPGQAIRAILTSTRALADGSVEVEVEADPNAMRAQLLALPRIGPWTAAYIAMRVLGDPDAWLSGDVALVAGAKAIGILAPDIPKRAAHRILADRATRWAPWRSYAAMHLWQAASATPRSGITE